MTLVYKDAALTTTAEPVPTISLFMMNRVKTDVPDPGSASATHIERTRVGDMADADTYVTQR